MGRSQNSSQPKCWLFQSGEKETTWWRGEDREIQPTFVTKNLGGEFKIEPFEFSGKISGRHPGKYKPQSENAHRVDDHWYTRDHRDDGYLHPPGTVPLPS